MSNKIHTIYIYANCKTKHTLTIYCINCYCSDRNFLIRYYNYDFKKSE